MYAFVANGKYILHITEDAHDAKTHQQREGCGCDDAGVLGYPHCGTFILAPPLFIRI